MIQYAIKRMVNGHSKNPLYDYAIAMFNCEAAAQKRLDDILTDKNKEVK